MSEVPANYSSENPIPFHKPIEDLGLSRRALNCLKGLEGIATVGGVAEMTAQGLLSIKGFGQKCLADVQCQLKKYGRSLSTPPPPAPPPLQPRSYISFPVRR